MNNFIGGAFLSDLSICDKLIDIHENNSNKTIVEADYKKCEETYIDPQSNDVIVNTYVNLLQEVCNQYKSNYTFCNEGLYWSIREGVKIQKYHPNDAYYYWHYERNVEGDIQARRHLGFLTYLNDVHDAGETEFFYQQLKIKPQKGFTIIFPAEWTHTHRGLASQTETKYIVTGWYNYH